MQRLICLPKKALTRRPWTISWLLPGYRERTFFRYFGSKNDLLGQGMLTYAEALKAAIEACPKSAEVFDVLRKAVFEIATTVASIPRTRDVIAVSIKCSAAREAQLSRMGAVEEIVSQAFAARVRKGRENELIFATACRTDSQDLLDLTMRLWFEGGSKDVTVVAERVITRLCNLVPAAGL